MTWSHSDPDATLWTSHHQSSAEAVVAAAEAGDLQKALLALEQVSDDRSKVCQETLDDWAHAVSRAGSGLEVLRAVLVGEGLVGDTTDYYAVRNSLLSRVVQNRRGMPIVVAAVWAIVGRGADMDCQGIGLPGHFILSVDGQLVDPFSRGRALTTEDAVAIVKHHRPKARFDARWLKPVSTKHWVARVLTNLAGSWHRADEPAQHYRARRFIRHLMDEPAAWSAEAYAALLLEVPGLAAEAWKTLSDRWPNSDEATVARQRLKALSHNGQVVH